MQVYIVFERNASSFPLFFCHAVLCGWLSSAILFDEAFNFAAIGLMSLIAERGASPMQLRNPESMQGWGEPHQGREAGKGSESLAFDGESQHPGNILASVY